jgi:hypothetical protein
MSKMRKQKISDFHNQTCISNALGGGLDKGSAVIHDMDLCANFGALQIVFLCVVPNNVYGKTNSVGIWMFRNGSSGHCANEFAPA